MAFLKYMNKKTNKFRSLNFEENFSNNEFRQWFKQNSEDNASSIFEIHAGRWVFTEICTDFSLEIRKIKKRNQKIWVHKMMKGIYRPLLERHR